VTSNETNGIHEDMVEEAVRVAERAEQENVDLRLLGGVAIKVRARERLQPAFEREYADLDWIIPKGKSSKTQKLFESLGYAPQTRFNALYGRERLLYFDEEHDRQVDVLVGTFRMSHEIPFGKRMTLEPLTVPLAELLLTKLQIIELNEKDVRDALALLHDHAVGEEDGDSVNGAHIAKLCASDWGLWRTFTANLEALEGHLQRYELADEGKDRIKDRIRALLERIEEEPKGFGWKMRAKIGDRKRWYELPEEVEGGP
jgi:cation transport regulator ChaC